MSITVQILLKTDRNARFLMRAISSETESDRTPMSTAFKLLAAADFTLSSKRPSFTRRNIEFCNSSKFLGTLTIILYTERSEEDVRPFSSIIA
jgi:hypothetical protein